MDKTQITTSYAGALPEKVKKKNGLSLWLIFYLLIYFVAVLKIATIKELESGVLFATYSIAVGVYIISRFALSYLYSGTSGGGRPVTNIPDKHGEIENSFLPTVTFAVPAKNEGDNIRETIVKMAESDYPKDKFDIIAVNDGSTDNTYEEMLAAKEEVEKSGIAMEIVDWKENKGKREGMAECTRRSTKEIVFFVDSDSFIAPDALRLMVKYFKNPKVGAVAGHAYVANAETNALTKMQAVRYYVAFKAYKAAEALFGTVTCCSGCCSAYRRSAIMPFLERWARQKFLGVHCTYGDDRSLTNYTLYYGYDTIFAPEVTAHTFVPDTYAKFMRQQLRWKKSWIRESIIASTFIWKKNIIMSLSFYASLILTLAAPIIVLRAIFWYPLQTSEPPLFYLVGLLLMAIIYGLYYFIYTRDRKWVYGVLFATFYTLVLIWQLPYAFISLRDSSWGTR